MALSDEKIEELNCIDIDRLDYEVFEINKDSVKEFALSIETEVRKQDDALIRQMLEALEEVDQAMPFPVAKQAITAARARLRGK